MREERFDENEERDYNRHRKVLPVDGQPQPRFELRKPAYDWMPEAGVLMPLMQRYKSSP